MTPCATSAAAPAPAAASPRPAAAETTEATTTAVPVERKRRSRASRAESTSLVWASGSASPTRRTRLMASGIPRRCTAVAASSASHGRAEQPHAEGHPDRGAVAPLVRPEDLDGRTEAGVGEGVGDLDGDERDGGRTELRGAQEPGQHEEDDALRGPAGDLAADSPHPAAGGGPPELVARRARVTGGRRPS